MATGNFIVTSLPDWVKTNKDMFLKNFGLVGTGTRGRIGLQTGIKSKEQLNYFDVDPVFQDGSDCGFNPLGTVTLTARNIEVAIIKIDLSVCPKNLLGTYAEYLVKVSATEQDLPFEEYIMDGISKSINKFIEKLIWQGDKSSTDDQLKFIDGFIALAEDTTGVISTTLTGITSAYAALQAVYLALPEEVLERGGEIYVSPAVYRAFCQELVDKNLYHYASAADGSAPSEIYLPGTDVKIVKTAGLAGTLYVLGTFAKNLVYGTDFENDAEEVDVHYSRDTKKFNISVSWASGVQIAFPEMVVLGKFDSAPVVPADSATALAELASADHVFKTKEQTA